MTELQKSSSNDARETSSQSQGEPVPVSENRVVVENDHTNTLHARLNFNDLMYAFVDEVRSVLNFDGIKYSHPGNNFHFIKGALSKHRCEYEIIFGEQLLGAISFTRDTKFIESELHKIEKMVAGLALPLRNSIKYQTALRHVQAHELSSSSDEREGLYNDSAMPVSQKIYLQLIDELLNSKRETEQLQSLLHESRNKMLIDPLTGLPNRAAYDERIALEEIRIRRTKMPLCLAVWDIDYFKKVNDTYGHDIGDQVLMHFSKIVRTRLRRVDLFARIGGEEFVLLMPDTSIKKALEINNRLRVLLEKSVFHNNGELLPVTASVGIADFTDEDLSDNVLKKADIALYKSKKAGRNCCTVYLASDNIGNKKARTKQHKSRRM